MKIIIDTDLKQLSVEDWRMLLIGGRLILTSTKCLEK